MSPAITFYTNPMSRGGIVHWMLEEIGEPYDMQVIEYGPAMKSDDYLRINPMGKVPAIVHDGRIVTEVAAICAYLADAFPDANLAPPRAERADYYRWLFFAAGPLEAAVGAKACGLEPTEKQQAMLGFGSLDRTLDTLAGAVRDRRYIAGEHFSAADVYVGSQIGWGMQFGTIDERPEFVAYWTGLKDRPGRLVAERFMQEAMQKAGMT
ncbi:glutathione S-transferase family protein [Wenzhouxiangella sp. XN201]|uniref:glutathione S-transferase family protein n=1 Tax=Wenzhouxiangella sp. XN201 TaxID=2710755 RepID=UPI0013C78DB7|nr:glutathione S-transferase family protein [Wenzhouxiangella sp. XN201]NEZ04390.1 glutathione S-transferase family protein [Wenzhouxiangella sp. XN201]